MEGTLSLEQYFIAKSNLELGLLEFYECPACKSCGFMVHLTSKPSQEYIKKLDEILEDDKKYWLSGLGKYFYCGDCFDCNFSTESYDTPEDVFLKVGIQKKDNSEEVEAISKKIKEAEDISKAASILMEYWLEKNDKRKKKNRDDVK